MTPRVAAVLGPTNTGKTHYAIERMLAHRTGIIGLPLRLLAREVYDRVVRLRGPSVVALVTGEERIVPDRAAYWVCTVEAMPQGMGADFLAVDEIQLCADPERGHVFTDRLLHARGLHETLFLGSATMRGAIAALVPGVTFLSRERFSTLTHTGPRKIARMPERSAIVAFSVESVYAIAEYLRRTRGGAAVVMGALSPRTRNAQVALYQSGEVDFLVATDAIGMGLNLDIAHVAFAGTTKFDGRRLRELTADELAQIAGRAGRHTAPGTFGTTGEAPDLDPALAEAIETHSFRPVTRLQWRNSRLQFGSVSRLIASLEERTDNPWLGRVREADDLAALRALAADAEVAARASDGPSVRLLWDVCRIPDFRGISRGEHAALLATVFNHLHQRGRLPEPFLAEAVRRLDRTDGDIDALSRRLAFIRTWTYVAQRKGWVADEGHWREETRAVEDRLSDALHRALTERFVDKRTSTLARRLRQKEVLVAEVSEKGEVTVEGHPVGRIEGFRFRAERASSPEEARTLRQAAAQALAPQFHLRADRFYNAPDTEIDFTEQGGLMWGEHAVGRLARGPEPLRPEIVPFVDEEAGPDLVQKVQRRLQHFMDRRIAAAMEPLLALSRDEALPPLARGFAYRLGENLGILPRGEVAAEVRALDPEARAALRRHGVRIGQFTVFLPALLKPAPTRLRLVLWSLWKGLEDFPAAPPPGHVTVPADGEHPPGFWPMAGFRAAGERAIRIDMLERLADLLRDRDSRQGFEAAPEMLSITGLSLDAFARLMEGLGYRAERGERPRQRPARAARPPAPDPSASGPAAAEPPAPGAPAPVEEPPAPDAPPDSPPVEPPGPDLPEPDLPPDGPARPDTPPAELPSETPGEAPDRPPAELPGDIPSETPPDAPADLPDPPSAPEMPEPPGPSDLPTMAAAPGSDGPAAETEVFYTFTWSGRPARRSGDRAAAPAPRPREDRPREGRPARSPRQGGGAGRDRVAAERGDRHPSRPERSGQGQGTPRPPRQPEPRPARDSVPAARGRVDPDNPFAAALAGFKVK
ncbi:helicase-related protein [Rubellimicrobium sp. CFH 75288]|uniref:helicase-related protein n=1 Tax=Rubellimicrobium sp. CFH 75288 TaxID=2697034 RepID=UPI0014120670|nr:helicase-related protein [Rubellimicrobium sp. CFH 75288]NAZ35495.1 disulfide oxidoreductase [Rubellimicrobium sp. CFH 75288]